MPPPALLDPATLDFSQLLADRAAIRAVNPHRFEFELLDGIVYVDLATGLFAGFHDVKPDAWWVRGHIPGRPLFPGVLMIECAAQLASYMNYRYNGANSFLGFTKVDGVKFRGQIEPPARLVLIGHARESRPRRTICDAQGFLNNTMVFEGTITGMPI